MTDDLVTRLRAEGGHATCACVGCEARREAADEIERLRAKVALLSERLPGDARILDVCDGLDADTVEMALLSLRYDRALADWKPRAER